MSADNYLFVFKRGDKYVVQDRSASGEYTDADKESRGREFDSLQAANAYAATQYTEYGIVYDFPTRVVEE